MGICTSCESTAVATAKVVLQDGRLQEFSYPVKASYVLSKNPDVFICNSEDMDFNGVVSAVRDDEELQPGELYFALPKTKLCRPLQPEEIAALALKANAALLKTRSKSGFFRGDCEHNKKYAANGRRKGDVNGNGNENGNVNGSRNTRNGNRRTAKMYVANLTAIPE